MSIKQQGSMRHIIEKIFVLKSRTNKCIWLILLVLFLTTPSKGEESNLLRIGTGGQTGVYYPIGKIIAQGLTSDRSIEESVKPGENGVPGYIGVAQYSAGSIDNVLNVVSGTIEAGLVQADVAAWALGGDRIFKGNDRAKSIRAVASLYPEKFQIVTRKDANIRNVHDLRGKRISIDEIGSGTLAVMRIVLEAYGMTENDILPVYLKPVFTREKIISGELQGFVMMAGAPMAAVSQLSSVGISLVPILPEFAERIESKYPYLVPGQIPANVYPGIPEISTIQVHALLVVNETMDDALVYQITAALWSHRMNTMLETGHAQGKSITPATALVGISIPLHPGAKKYYQENSERFSGS
jgi:TRAP transporter TAXI family solute receptor